MSRCAWWVKAFDLLFGAGSLARHPAPYCRDRGAFSVVKNFFVEFSVATGIGREQLA